MEVCTIGFAGRPAPDFFAALKGAGIRRLIDVRLNNTSQLAGFTKRADLPYLLREICDAEYLHLPLLAPTRELLDTYKKRSGPWAEYERGFMALLAERRVEQQLGRTLFEMPSVLLCSERTAEHCHRRLVCEYLAAAWGDLTAVHL